MSGRDVDVVVVGAGVVGTACAAALARRGLSLVLIEQRDGAGRETSSRNSGVIHAGIHYPEGSLKASLCVEGRERLYARCAALGIPHRKTGKLVLAVHPAEEAALERILVLAAAAGVGDLVELDRAQLAAREPGLTAHAALWCPHSGVVDAHALVESYKNEAASHGAEIAFHTRVIGLEHDGQNWTVRARGERGEESAVRASWIVNATGLECDDVARMAGLDADALGWRIHWCKGDYFVLGAGSPRPRAALVYPVPDALGLGIHLTVDLGGRCIAGPDAAYVDRIDYSVDAGKAIEFARAVGTFLPGLRPEHLAPDYAGIRPKLQPPGGSFRDFVIADGSELGAPRSLHLIGIESPGLTAAGAIAERVAAMIPA